MQVSVMMTLAFVIAMEHMGEFLHQSMRHPVLTSPTWLTYPIPVTPPTVLQIVLSSALKLDKEVDFQGAQLRMYSVFSLICTVIIRIITMHCVLRYTIVSPCSMRAFYKCVMLLKYAGYFVGLCLVMTTSIFDYVFLKYQHGMQCCCTSGTPPIQQGRPMILDYCSPNQVLASCWVYCHWDWRLSIFIWSEMSIKVYHDILFWESHMLLVYWQLLVMPISESLLAN